MAKGLLINQCQEFIKLHGFIDSGKEAYTGEIVSITKGTRHKEYRTVAYEIVSFMGGNTYHNRELIYSLGYRFNKIDGWYKSYTSREQLESDLQKMEHIIVSSFGIETKYKDGRRLENNSLRG